jgi:hypothetical protein
VIGTQDDKLWLTILLLNFPAVANVLKCLGVKRGDTIPLYIFMTWKVFLVQFRVDVQPLA